MQWRDVEYSVVQSIGKPSWKWKIAMSGQSVATHGEARSRTLAITAAIRAIEKSVARQLRGAPDATSSNATSDPPQHARP